MKLLIVIPAYNEAENIVRTVEEIRKTVPMYDYVIVNDGSSDKTAQLCREHCYPMFDLPTNLGLTGAFQTGCRYALENGYDAVIQIDADGQHDPKYIPQMVELMEKKDLDLVMASRFVTEKRPHTMRMLGNALIKWAILMTTRTRVTDPTSGMRIFGKRVLPEMAYDIHSRPEPDTIAYLLRKGMRMEEIQVHMRERQAGTSYLGFSRSMAYMVQMGMNIFFIQWVRK